MTYTDPNREKFNDERKVHVNQSNGGNGRAIALAIAAFVLVLGGLMYFLGNPGASTVGPQVTLNNTTLPAPVIDEPATPVPSTPQAAQSTTPPAQAPATSTY